MRTSNASKHIELCFQVSYKVPGSWRFRANVQRLIRRRSLSRAPWPLDPAGQLILRRLVAQAAISERREARLRQLRAQDQDGGEDADALAALHGVSAKTVAYLLGQLRATPRSRIVPRAAGPQFEQALKLRPWEIKARA